MLDLSPDESSGAEFSLILFSFSKECLTGNHHRSKNTRVPCTKSLQVLWSALALGRARNCKTNSHPFPESNGPQLHTWEPRDALFLLQVPKGQDAWTAAPASSTKTWATRVLGAIQVLLTFYFKCLWESQEHQKSSLEDQLCTIRHPSMLWGHFVWTSPMAHAG